MRFAICNEVFQGWKLEDAFAFAAKTGYDGVEIAPFTLARSVTGVPAAERRRIRDLANRWRLEVSGIHWVLAQTEGLHLTHPDRAVRDRTACYLGQLIDFCADLGGKFMVVGSPKQRDRLEGVSAEQAWEWATAVFRQPVMRAEERAVTVCLEPLSPTETNFINTAAEAIQFVQQLRTPHFKIILDVKAMSAENQPIPRIIRQSWPHFAYFHANDKNLKGPGFGEVDFRPIAAALEAVGYPGWVSVEVFNFDAGPEAIAIRSLEYLRKVFG
ncbi:MAG: sugar phosphate isomerase/epimerase [Verrucomicrobia bacterium]|nr:sugar phosphate isomerase/epimerase [Verrucomicrobiota bacterium]